MVAYRRRLGRAVTKLLGGFQYGGAALASGSDNDTVGKISWAVVLVIVVVASLTIANWLSVFQAEVCLAAIWGAFIGLTLLFFWPPQLLITTVGGWIGIGSANAAGAADVIEKISTTIHKITATISSTNDFTEHVLPGWIFSILLAVCCLPAYRGGTGGGWMGRGEGGSA
jgi:hypothetical protein